MLNDSENNEKSHNLFRSEAVSQAGSKYGSPVKPIGVGSWVVALFMAALLISIVIFMSFGQYSRKETVVGVLYPPDGAARIIAMRDGVVGDVFVNDGDIVRAGAPIVSVTGNASINSAEATTSYSDVLQASSDREIGAVVAEQIAIERISAESRAELEARRTGLQQDQISLTENISLQEERILLLEETLEAGRSLHERKLFATLALRQREEAVIAAKQSLASLRREARRNEATLNQLTAEERRISAQLAQSRADITQAREQLAQRDAQRQLDRSTVLTASRAGRLTALQVRDGAPVRAGRTLAVILPLDKALQAELWLPSRAAGFVRPGDDVRLMYDAFPYQKFGVGLGKVASIAGAPTDPADLPIPVETPEALYRVIVTLEDATVDGYGRDWQLTPGMRLSADLVFDRRSLWEWVMDPIIAARQRSA